MTNGNTRAVVLDVLIEVLENKKFCHIVLSNTLAQYNRMPKMDRSFIARMSEGTVEKCIELDFILNKFSKIKTEKMKPVIRNILRMSLYQLKYMDSVPDRAVCSEALKLCERRGYPGLKGFVNGVLRNIIRNKEKWITDSESCSIRYSMPEWITDMWERAYGSGKTEAMLQSLGEEKRLCIRRNASKCDREEFIRLLERDKVKYEPSDISEDIFYLTGIDRLQDMESFQDGYFQVQDMSSVLAGYAAAPKPGDICMDVCAAPGGKTIHIADMLEGTGCVYARDIKEEKTKLILDNVKRTGFSNIKVQVWDALEADTAMKEKADIVIADLPCSGLGVISKKPDIKYRVCREDIGELVKLQRKILLTVSEYVKPGGRLVYSTCTVNKEENDGNREWILHNLPFEPESVSLRFPSKLQYDTLKEGYVQIFPGDYGMNGFFIAVFKKTQKGTEG